MDAYEINGLTGDQWNCDTIKQYLLQWGVYYKIVPFNALTRGKIFSGLKHLATQGAIQIADDPDLISQLRSMSEEKNERGQIDIRPSTRKDDLAVALALAVNELMTELPLLPFESVPVVSRRSLRYDSYACPKAARCLNFPRCMDEGCLLFADDGTPW